MIFASFVFNVFKILNQEPRLKTAGLLRLEQSDLEMSLSAAKFMHLKNSKVKTEEYLISISHLPRLL